MLIMKLHLMAGSLIGLYFFVSIILARGFKGVRKKDWIFCLLICPIGGYVILGMFLFFIAEEIYSIWGKEK